MLHDSPSKLTDSAAWKLSKLPEITKLEKRELFFVGVTAFSSPEQFVEALGWIFEESPWVAERAWASGPFADIDALHRAMADVVAAATREEQLALLRAHPDLGTRARVSEASREEQAGAGVDRLTPEEVDRLAAYRERFGFPFLFAVRSGTKQDMLRGLDERLHHSPEAEFQEALRQVYRIARFRLESALS
jgi:2-oxo-4-hydroxy-4-carboxy-5-ureidoimidazoline decarboxylase